jgi:hypothetical protein
MMRIKTALAACGTIAMLLATATTGGAIGTASDTNYLTFSGAVALPGVELQAGTYIFERASSTDLTLVRVLSSDRKQVFLTAFTNTVDRPDNLPSDQVVSLGESARGVAPPIRIWYPIYNSIGHEFIYNR